MHRTAIWLSAPLSTLLLTACSADLPPLTEVRIERIEIPAVLLTCAPTPAPPPKPRTQGDVARYIVDLWEAGEDCRARVEAIRELQKP